MSTESSPSPFKGEEGLFYKIVRLKTGENIVCSMNRNVQSITQEPYLSMTNPVMIVLSKQILRDNDTVAEQYLFRPWMGASDSQDFVIPTDIALTIGDLKNVFVLKYLEYVHEVARLDRVFKKEQQIEIDRQMIYNLLKDVNEGRPVHIVTENDSD